MKAVSVFYCCWCHEIIHRPTIIRPDGYPNERICNIVCRANFVGDASV